MLRRLLHHLHMDGYFGSVILRRHPFALHHRPLADTFDVMESGKLSRKFKTHVGDFGPE